MDHRDYRLFVHLAESRHFARSARALHLSPSALTRAIQRIEQELDQSLLERAPSGVQLTAAGERFREFARQQIAAWETFEQELANEGHSPSGELRIACTVTACYSILPDLIARCRERYPRIALKLVTQDGETSMQQLAQSEVDLAVVPLPDQLGADMVSVALGQTALVFIAPTASVPWEGKLQKRTIEWEQVPLVAPLRGLERQRLDQWLGSRKATPRIEAEVRGNEGILAMVSMGCGVGLVPELVLERSPQADLVRPLTGVRPPRGYTVGLCAQRRGLERPAVGAFWELAGADPSTER